MEEVFLKNFWDEEQILFYFHFQNRIAVRQVEISPKGKIFLDADNPEQGDSMLADQPLDDFVLLETDLIAKEEFEAIWNNR